MNKKEAKQRIHNLEEELSELKHLLDQPEGRWRAEEGESYFRVWGCGDVSGDIEFGNERNQSLHNKGNYFKTEEQAKASNIYKILNSEYNYYIAGVSDNFDDVPRDGSAEWYGHDWYFATDCHDHRKFFNYRWKRI